MDLEKATPKDLVQALSKFSEQLILRELRSNIKMCMLIDRDYQRRVNAKIGEVQQNFCDENCEIILAVMRRTFGMGKTRLERFLVQYDRMVRELEHYYKMEAVEDVRPVCKKILEECGFSLAQFKKEFKYGIKLEGGEVNE